jgi:hypothetical protein
LGAEWGRIADLFGTVDLFGVTQVTFSPPLADWQETSEEKSGFNLQLKDRMQWDRFISRDPTGVVQQTLTALIVWGLLALFNQGGESGEFSPKKPWRKLWAAMHQALFDLGRRCQQGGDPPT